MKRLFIGLMLISSVSTFASGPSFMVSYGPIKEQLKNFNYRLLKDSKIPLGGGEVIIAESCFDILKEMSVVNNNLHGFLLINSPGDTNGICLIKADLNY